MTSPTDRVTVPAEQPLESTWASELKIETIVETALYADCLDEMERFYSDIMRLTVITKEAGRHVFLMVGPASVLLIFDPETTRLGHQFPSHGATGAGHVAFGVSAQSLNGWRNHLNRRSIAIEKEHPWPSGGHSIYFRDPAGNSVELITPRVWGTPAGW